MKKNDFKLLGKGLDHPLRLSLGEIKEVLSSLFYEEKIEFFWKKKKQIIGKKFVHYTASLIQKALTRVKPESKVGFSISDKTGKTTGFLFVKGSTMIFKFDTIQGAPYIDDFNLKSETEADILTNWRLVPESSQQIFSFKGLFGMQRKETTMIEVKISEDKQKKDIYTPDTPVKGEKEFDQDDKRKIFESKLRYLKELKQKNLISEESYEGKVQNLLDQL